MSWVASLLEYDASRKGEGEFASLSGAKVMLEPGGSQGPSEAGRDNTAQSGYRGALRRERACRECLTEGHSPGTAGLEA